MKLRAHNIDITEGVPIAGLGTRHRLIASGGYPSRVRGNRLIASGDTHRGFVATSSSRAEDTHRGFDGDRRRAGSKRAGNRNRGSARLGLRSRSGTRVTPEVRLSATIRDPRTIILLVELFSGLCIARLAMKELEIKLAKYLTSETDEWCLRHLDNKWRSQTKSASSLLQDAAARQATIGH